MARMEPALSLGHRPAAARNDYDLHRRTSGNEGVPPVSGPCVATIHFRLRRAHD